ncbi:SDR family oxidoreductase [Phytoactinopolyspora alkaliphila]|uniref:SDR family oxidoreductase n=1 Tax=Phytoactinopolyspora alkaliphila TaxID=1783498 RepID=A0A6N9YPU2_9ACTN|nr:SDR family oxidoreductase [Phytoactinopolyspora alkaliphila]
MTRQVLVVGGTSGIGAAIAERFTAAGAHVTAAGLDAHRAAGTLAAAEFAELDLREPEQVTSLMAGLPRLDVLVNAAGILRRDDEFDPDVFRDVVAVNLEGTMRTCVAAREALAAARGCIVNIASMLTFFGGPRVPAYSASKGGIAQLTKSLAVAWAEAGIRVNAVAPGWIRTDMTAGLRNEPTVNGQIMQRTPMRRWGEAAEVAGAVAFLAGPDAAFITGVVLPVDGGYLAT